MSAQDQAFSVFSDFGEYTSSDVAQRAGIEASTARGAIRNLLAAGQIERCPSTYGAPRYRGMPEGAATIAQRAIASRPALQAVWTSMEVEA